MKYNLVKVGVVAMLILALTGCSGGSNPQNLKETDVNSISQQNEIDGGNVSGNEGNATDNEGYTTDNEGYTTDNEGYTTDNEGNTTDSTDSDGRTKGPLIQDLENLVLSDANSVLVAAYVRGHINEALPEEADYMVEILLEMQAALIQKSHEGILYESAYMDALNNTMGGVLDPDKISEIKDDGVRAFYQSVVDSDLTMVRYEETPVLETNWEKIKSYQATFTEPFQMVVDFHNYNDLIRKENVEEMTRRVYAMEEMLLKAPSGFAKNELADLYSTYVSRMLAGPEGAYLYRLTDVSDPYYKKMALAVEEHETSGFAKVTKNMMAQKTKTFEHLIDIVERYRLNNPYGKHQWEEGTIEDGNAKVTMLTYKSEDAIVSERINAILLAASDELIKSSGASSNYDIEMYKTYQSGNFATVHLYINYATKDGETHYDEKVVNLDLKNGIELTLNTLLNTSDADVLDKVNTLSESDFSTTPSFSLTVTGLLLTGEKENAADIKVATITKDKLLKIQLQMIMYPVHINM